MGFSGTSREDFFGIPATKILTNHRSLWVCFFQNALGIGKSIVLATDFLRSLEIGEMSQNSTWISFGYERPCQLPTHRCLF